MAPVTQILILALFYLSHYVQSKGCDLKLKYSVALKDTNGDPIAVESAESDAKRNAILLSTRSTNQVIRIDRNTGNILDMPYIDNIPHPRGSSVIDDLFFVLAGNSVRIYDINENNVNAPEYIDDIFPENTLSNHAYNGLCVTPDNRFLYVTDPGFVFGPSGGPSNTGGIWRIDLYDYSKVQEIVPLGTRIQPNGCVVDNDGHLLFGARGDTSTDPATPTSVVYVWDEKNNDIILLNLNGLTMGIDGLVVDKNDNLFLTENKIGQEAFQINLNRFIGCVLYDEPKHCNQDRKLDLNNVDITLDNPADIGYDAEKHYLLVPSMNAESTENFAVYKIKHCKCP